MDCRRLVTGLIIGCSAFVALLFGGIWLACLIFGISVYGAKEYTEILKHKGFLPSYRIILLSSIGFGLLAFFNLNEYMVFLMILTAVLALMSVLFRGRQPYIANVATTIFGAIYCGWFPMHLLMMRNLGLNCLTCPIEHPAGASYCIILLIGVLLTDTFCYFTGCKYGKHKLSPVISPNKTIEGAIGGTVMCLIFTVAMGIYMELTWYHALIMGLLIAGFAQIGDLCESMIKRDAGVKDSSNILPGHGGFLDRTDSYILTIPVLYYYLLYFVQNF
ncbi:MAG: phosphatidate cytidylyltransferase [bacterium]|nr:phosphatidate cytidylyltransferase [bacterium]